ncbi:MAG: amidophosphoribosyltransferase [Pseudomonadota bacterium]
MSFLDEDKLHEECGVFGIFNHKDAAALVALGLHALQHRGQEGAGIVTFDGKQFHAERHRGLIGDTFSKASDINRLRGDRAIGHTRYSTAGGDDIRNIQPFFAEFSGGGFAVAHNGNLTNAITLRRQLQRQGSIFQSTSDTETLLHLLAMSKENTFVERLESALRQLEGAFSFVGLTNKKMIGCRDPHGIRPLVLGDLDGSYILASETCALDIIGARHVRDIEPGELVIITDRGIRSLRPFPETEKRLCMFEYVYFARPDSIVEGKSVYEVRKQIGMELANELPADADMVVPIPDSGVPAAIGYAQGANLPFELGIIRNHYVGRTFIQPTSSMRHMSVRLKHNANRTLIQGKKVVLIDDSVVRGTTSKKIVQMVRDAGAASVHLRVASPPIAFPDFYGVDTPEAHNLLASRMTVEEMQEYIRVDSLGFISLDGLYRAIGETARNNENPQYCDSCFSGDYPTKLTDQEDFEDFSNVALLSEAAG